MQMSATREKHVFAKTWKWISSLDWKNWVTSCHSPDCALRRWKVPAIATRFRGVRYRNRWYHQPACLQNALATQLDRFLLPPQQFAHKTHRLPFGLLLIKRGAISPGQLRDALQRQRHAGYGNLSVWLRQAVDLQESEIAATLAQQCGCPLFPLQRGAAATFLPTVPPYPLFLAANALPVHNSTDGRRLLVAFSERVDHTLLYALDEMLDCRTFACVATSSAVNEGLELWRQRAAGTEICFDSLQSPAEMAATIVSYAAQLDARDVKLVRAGHYLWAAFFRKSSRKDLLFRVPVGAPTISAAAMAASHKAFLPSVDRERDGTGDATDPL